MKIGYARVSTQDQSLDQQLDALKAYGCESIYTDVASGGNIKRSGFEEAMKALRKNDVLVVWKLDRLGRSLGHLVKTVESLALANISFKSLNDPIDTTTPAGKMIFGIFASLAEFELSLIRERTNAGLLAARKRGRFGGRKKLLSKNQVETIKTLYDSKKMTVLEICEQVNISRKTFYNYLNLDKQSHGNIVN